MEKDQLSLFNPGNSKPSTASDAATASWDDLPFLVVDTETTGLHPHKDSIIELAWIFCRNGHLISRGSHLLQHREPLSTEIKQLTGITDEMLWHATPWTALMPDFTKLIQEASFMVAYNADFDRRFLERAYKNEGSALPVLPWVDPCVFIKEFDKYKKGKKLTDASKRWGINLHGAHRALADATATAELLMKMRARIGAKPIEALIEQQQKLKTAQDKSFQEYLARKNASSGATE